MPGPTGKLSFSKFDYGTPLSLPCGRCIGCRMEKQRQWAVRLMHECEMHEDTCFLTLTYRDENLPEYLSLVKGHVQQFMKCLRERVRPRLLRFFLSGEYGDDDQRLDKKRPINPHYHVILFGYSFPDKFYWTTLGEHKLYRSELLEDVWSHGFCSVGSVTFDSCSYVAKYTTKKLTGEKAKEYGKRIPEFALMSRRPGIGATWFDKYRSDVYPSDEVIVKGHVTRPPRYYDIREKQTNPEGFESVARDRERFADNLNEKVKMPDGSVREFHPSAVAHRLAVRERVAAAKLKIRRSSKC